MWIIYLFKTDVPDAPFQFGGLHSDLKAALDSVYHLSMTGFFCRIEICSITPDEVNKLV